MKTMKKFFEQQSELQVAKCLLVHLQSSRYKIRSLELRKKRKARQQGGLPVANDIVLIEVAVYHERVYADNVVSKFWHVRSFSSQHYTKFIANCTSEKVSQIWTKEFKTRSFICKVYLHYLRSWRHFNCDTILLWLCVSWMRVFIAWTISVREEYRPGSR